MKSHRPPGRQVLIDILVGETGSTLTKVHAFGDMDSVPRLLGQGFYPTTVDDGDVFIGLERALDDLTLSLGHNPEASLTFANSSAAGGLKMTAHGLTYDMTLRAAREACLGAGAVLRHVTAGAIRERDLKAVDAVCPNLIMLAGGVDYGESNAVIDNAHALTRIQSRPPVVYAGNRALASEISDILSNAGFEAFVTENVYPRVDELNLEPVRQIVREIFSRHIITAPGMEKVREWAGGDIIPTPGAVLVAAELLAEALGDIVVIDIGGATTDIHSVTDPTPEIASIMTEPVPRARRTVEGDLGVFRNAANVLELIGDPTLAPPLSPVPTDAGAIALYHRLAHRAAETAMERHAGEVRQIYTATGPRRIAQGTDLTGVKWIIGTGGPLSKLPDAKTILSSLCRPHGGARLLPGPGTRTAPDRYYVLSACGTFGAKFPDAARAAALMSLDV